MPARSAEPPRSPDDSTPDGRDTTFLHGGQMRQLEELGPWYHQIRLDDDTVTPGKSNVAGKLAQFDQHLPDVDGARVLDLGCNAGGIAVELARRGAKVVGVEASAHYFQQACWVRDHLGLNIDYRNIPLYQLNRIAGTFDVVLFLGLIYHLRYPQLALDLLAAKCDGTFIVNTPVVRTSNRVLECRIPEEVDRRIGQEDESRYNFWFPSPPALHMMLTIAGFTNIEQIAGTDVPFVSSTETERNESGFDTGTVMLKATGDGSGTLPF